MSSKPFRRKDLKHDDELVNLTGAVTKWLLERRRRIGWLLLGVALVMSIVLGVRFAHQQQESRASELLATAMEVYRAPVIAAGQESVDTSAEAQNDAITVDSGSPEIPEVDPAVTGNGFVDDPVVAPNPEISGLHFGSQEEKCRAALERFGPIVERYANRPSGHVAAFYSGDCQVQLGDTDAAIEAFTQAAEARGSLVSSIALYRLGQLERGRRNPEAAVAYFDRLLEDGRNLFPREEALIAKARTHQEAGNASAALASYQRVADEFGDSYSAGEARSRIAELSAQLGLDPDVEGN